MTSIRKQISDRMSLRKPQVVSLERLEKLIEILPMGLAADSDLRDLEAQVAQMFPGFETFERNFPNFCFALATGVGKTRLMGAMIAYLAEAKGIRNFVILAPPSTTITEKLVREFSNPGDPKYVFKGLPDFANRFPRIVTGENYDDGSGLSRPNAEFFDPESITINIFKQTQAKARFLSETWSIVSLCLKHSRPGISKDWASGEDPILTARLYQKRLSKD
jgi:type III restriction enzyme